jgi:PAS domain-containing protein
LHIRTIPGKADAIAIAQILAVSISEISDLTENETFTQPKNVINNIEASIYTLDKIIKKYDNLPGNEIEHLIKINDTVKQTLKENQICNRALTRYSALLDSIDLIVYVKDSKRLIKKVNNNFITCCSPNYTEEEIVGSKFIDLFGRKDIENIVLLENKVFNTGIRIKDESIKIPGMPKHVGLISISPILNSENNVIEIASSIKDITRINNLIDKERLLKNILNQLEKEWVWIKRFNPQKFNFISLGASKTLGFDNNEYHMYPEILLSKIHPDDRERYKKTTSESEYPFKIKFRVFNKENNIIWLEFTGFKTLDKNKIPLYYGISREITNDIIEENSRMELENAISSNDMVIMAIKFSFLEQKILHYKYISNNIYRVLGIKKENLVKGNISWFELIHDKDQKTFIKLIKNKIASKKITLRLNIKNKYKNIYTKVIAKSHTEDSHKSTPNEAEFYVYMHEVNNSTGTDTDTK